MNDHTSPSRRYPAINGDNIIKGISVGATTPLALADVFGVALDTDPRMNEIKQRIDALRAAGRLQIETNDSHTLSLVPEQAI